jgi:ABC-type glycerol-3-phosphate transport system permease component
MALAPRTKRRINNSIVYLVISIGAIVMVFPLIWTISTSLKTVDQLVFTTIELVPEPIAWENYLEVFRRTDIINNLRNTLLIVVCAEFGSLVMCSLTAYAFARIPFPGRDVVFALLLSSMMLPGVVQLIPFFVMFDRLGWINTFWPLIVPRFLAHNPFYIFLMRQFFMAIPQDLTDAARMDGATELGIWWRIVLPISAPVLATVAVFTFQFAWNWFLQPLVYLGGNKDLWTLALGLNAIKGMTTEQRTDHYQMAFSIIMIVPTIAVFAVGQRYIIQGITFTGLKG